MVDAEVFVTQLPPNAPKSIHTDHRPACIISTPEDMQVNDKHDRPFYFTRYVGSIEVSCIQVDLGFSLSIVPCQIMQLL